jgi:hypothetical protein
MRGANGVRNGSCDEARKLSLDSIVAESLAGESERMACRCDKPIVEATTKRFQEDMHEGGTRTGGG